MYQRRWRATVLLLPVVALALHAETLPPGVHQSALVEGITEYTFANGLRALLIPDKAQSKITISMTYFAGSRHEAYGETGMAHLLEHVMFSQTNGGRDARKELARNGANWNASTSWDRTNYFETLAASDDGLKWALAFEADRMRNLRIESASLEKEKGVVRNEFAMGENTPNRILLQRVLESAFTVHPYGRLPIGYRCDVDNMSAGRLKTFYEQFYQPDNALLAVAGRFDPTKALAWIQDSFGGIPRPPRLLARAPTVEPAQDGERSVTLRRVGSGQELAIVYHVPGATHPDIAALNVLAEILGNSQSGRLYKALVQGGKAFEAVMQIQELHDPGFALVQIRLRGNQSLAETRDVTLKTIEGLASQPPSIEEVSRAKNKLLKELELDFTNTQAVGLSIAEYAASADWRLLFLERDEIRRVTGEDVLRVAGAYLKASNRTLGEFIPGQDTDRVEIPAAPEAGLRLKDFKPGAAVAEGEVFIPTASEIGRRLVRMRLPGGMRLALLPKKTRGGSVIARIRLNFGDERSLSGKSSVGQLTAALLLRGAKTKSRQQIQDQMDLLQARVATSGGQASVVLAIETVEPNLSKALSLAAEILREPLLAAEELEVLKQERIAALESTMNEPDSRARTALLERLTRYPRGDIRHVRTPEEQIDDLRRVTIGQVQEFHARFYGASQAQLAIYGQFDAAGIQELATSLFGSWNSPSPYQPVSPAYQKTEPASEQIEIPGKQNAIFMAGMKVKMGDDDPEYPAMVIANYAFGGPGASRLFRRLRAGEGLSYSASSSFVAPPAGDGATFIVGATGAPERIPRVEAAFNEELTRALESGFTDDEVQEAKKAWLREQTVIRSQEDGLLGIIAERERTGRTVQWDEALERRVAGLTGADVSAAFQRHINASGLVRVKAGSFQRAGARLDGGPK